MIDRAEIEFTLAMAEKGVRAEAPAEVMAELCRVYLAWLDAPEVEIGGECSAFGDVFHFLPVDDGVVFALRGQRARILPATHEQGAGE